MRYLILRADGGVSVLTFKKDPDDATARREVSRWRQTADPSWLPIRGFRPALDEEITSLRLNRRFRDCVRHTGGAVRVDLEQGKQQVLRELREQRNQLLLESDALKQQVEDTGNNQQQKQVKDYRQQLRDLPTQIEQQLQSLASVEQLAAFAPSWPAKPTLQASRL